MDADHRVRKMYGPTTISNGLVWTRDAATMYFIDSPRKNVLAFDFDNTTGNLSNERVLWDTSALVGSPDGMTIDSENRLWIAFCHGGQVVCYDPGTRSEIERIPFPCTETTACAFGGPELRDLYVTTGLAKEPQELAGRLFVCRPGAVGVASMAFQG
jgi:sugar lactone lactonase YvrE